MRTEGRQRAERKVGAALPRSTGLAGSACQRVPERLEPQGTCVNAALSRVLRTRRDLCPSSLTEPPRHLTGPWARPCGLPAPRRPCPSGAARPRGSGSSRDGPDSASRFLSAEGDAAAAAGDEPAGHRRHAGGAVCAAGDRGPELQHVRAAAARALRPGAGSAGGRALRPGAGSAGGRASRARPRSSPALRLAGGMCTPPAT